MGMVYGITCRNPNCRYHVLLRSGDGWMLSKTSGMMEQDILSGTRKADDKVIDLVEQGYKVKYMGSYHCSSCREWMNLTTPYILELLHVSPYGTIRDYEVHYIEGIPKCPKCDTDLIYIIKPTSSKNHCPKCGSDNMRGYRAGYYD